MVAQLPRCCNSSTVEALTMTPARWMSPSTNRAIKTEMPVSLINEILLPLTKKRILTTVSQKQLNLCKNNLTEISESRYSLR